MGALNGRVTSHHSIGIGKGNLTRNAALALTFFLALLVASVPWPAIFESIYGYGMVDRGVYRNKVIMHDLPTDRLPWSLLSIFTYEFGWNSAFAFFVRSLGFSPETFFALVSVLVLWRFTYFVAHRASILHTVLLINPLVIDLAFSQLRSAAAIALLSFAWGGRSRSKVPLLYVLCATIHTSVVVIAALHIATVLLQEARFRNFLALAALSIVIAVALGPFRYEILSALGDRRAEYPDMSTSHAYMSFWIIMLAAIAFKWRWAMRAFDTRLALSVLTLAVSSHFVGAYATRWIAMFFPLLIVTMRHYPTSPISILTLMFLPFASLQWFYWLRLNT